MWAALNIVLNEGQISCFRFRHLSRSVVFWGVDSDCCCERVCVSWGLVCNEMVYMVHRHLSTAVCGVVSLQPLWSRSSRRRICLWLAFASPTPPTSLDSLTTPPTSSKCPGDPPDISSMPPTCPFHRSVVFRDSFNVGYNRCGGFPHPHPHHFVFSFCLVTG